MIALTAWNDKSIYIDPHEIAVIEPADGDVAFLAMPPEVKVAGAIVTLAAGRAIVVKEDQDAVYALIRPVLEPVVEATTNRSEWCVMSSAKDGCLNASHQDLPCARREIPKRTWTGWRRRAEKA
ncbi:flagellar FlbD family protein [Nocardia cyriacigeorgica]|uniref:flagellar FlbD family protein n=1 Tax=Nocardia cyriacigeorgica TaxID=135487 RepID=UPI0013BB3A47|nr:flagellar FlbD family protein [Nocardia cyriacigeorgica]NEW49356.1 flagellar FlbD family protein [Nocardia cyriacigeorgica]